MSNETVDMAQKEEYSLFPKQDNATTDVFSLPGVFLMNGKYMSTFWELFLAILAWMALTYIIVHVIAATVAVLKLRNHPYGFFIALPLLLMCVVGPATVGALTSAALAWALETGGKAVSPWHCAFLGIIQTTIIAFVSFSRVLATL
ncbi:hypothetical protein PMAYCL1PPCAC_24531 [Pristionchus mayeri]|uniref:Transmembrane protein 170A n=1 Tax=Pristionchus mayeri TaxID=1317129 RepID=A0AAN5D014_9BILA|nr:hypothetical protein PMAYCL1PPCAC_24531 [Pristionchus mayeri]